MKTEAEQIDEYVVELDVIDALCMKDLITIDEGILLLAMLVDGPYLIFSGPCLRTKQSWQC